MATYTVAEVQEGILDLVSGVAPCELYADNKGQLIIYTGVYRWDDNSYHDEPQSVDMRDPLGE